MKYKPGNIKEKIVENNKVSIGETLYNLSVIFQEIDNRTKEAK